MVDRIKTTQQANNEAAARKQFEAPKQPVGNPNPADHYVNQDLLHQRNLDSAGGNERQAELADSNPYSANSANSLVAQYRNAGEMAQQRGAVQVDGSRVNDIAAGIGTDGANQALRSELQGYGNSAGPSSAATQGKLANNSSLSAMLQQRAGGGSLARSLSGGGAAALATSSGVGNVRAGEMANRTNAYLGGMSGLRGNNMQNASNLAGAASAQSGIGAAQSQANLGQQALNDQYTQDMEQKAFGVRAGQVQQGIQDNQRAAGYSADSIASQANAINRAFQYAGSASAMGGSIASAGATAGGSQGGSGGGGGTSSNSLLNDTILGNGPSDERVKDLKGQETYSYGYPGDVKIAMEDYDARKASERAGVRPKNLTPGGRAPELDVELPGGNELSGLPESPREPDDDPYANPDRGVSFYAGPQDTSGEDVRSALAAEDARKSSTRKGVAPLDLKPGGKKPELATPKPRGNEYPGVASVLAPDTSVLADANRKMAGSPYTYKGAFVPPDEKPGQKHFGFMAQNLEKNPVTATAVQHRPDGVKEVHGMRMLQAVSSGVSDLQRQIDEMRKGGK